MTFVADESVDKPIVDRLRSDGDEVHFIGESDPGLSDESVLSLSNFKKALLNTADKDFDELLFRQRRVTAWGILIRLSGLPAEQKGRLVSDAIRMHSDEFIAAFSVISGSTTRIRKSVEARSG